MTPDPSSSAALEFVDRVAQAYARLMQTAAADRETGLGGRLFYAGELDDQGRAMVVAANIAGAATLVATANRSAQKQAIRDGVADFLITSLDEALRILKNQLRKRETVSVCVALPPATVECEMKERGVQPDLLRRDAALGPEDDRLTREERSHASKAETLAVLTWSVASAPAQWLPMLDAIALDCLDADAWQARRWLRLAPRFLGRLAHGLRLLRCDPVFAANFIERVRRQVKCGEIGVAVEIRSSFEGRHEDHLFAPAKP